MKHKISHVDIQLTLFDFGRCFSSVSTAFGALSDEKSISHPMIVRESMSSI